LSRARDLKLAKGMRVLAATRQIRLQHDGQRLGRIEQRCHERATHCRDEAGSHQRQASRAIEHSWSVLLGGAFTSEDVELTAREGVASRQHVEHLIERACQHDGRAAKAAAARRALRARLLAEGKRASVWQWLERRMEEVRSAEIECRDEEAAIELTNHRCKVLVR
jgi:hypothetical protein